MPSANRLFTLYQKLPPALVRGDPRDTRSRTTVLRASCIAHRHIWHRINYLGMNSVRGTANAVNKGDSGWQPAGHWESRVRTEQGRPWVFVRYVGGDEGEWDVAA